MAKYPLTANCKRQKKDSFYALHGYFISFQIFSLYTVFHKKDPPFFLNSLKWWSIYTKFVTVVAEEILIQNIATKYGSSCFLASRDAMLTS